MASPLLSSIDIVLVGTLTSGNIGSVARAMANMGLSRLSLVRPRCTIDQQSYAMATHGDGILSSARLFPSLRDALAGAVYVFGTTARGRRWRDCLELRELGARAVHHARGGRVALVFGPEDMGLSNDELELCNEVVTIPTVQGASSLNISHAVLLVCYELFSASREGKALDGASIDPAPVAMVEAMYDHMRESLLEIGFLNPQNPEYTLGMIRRMLTRTVLSVPEVRMLRGLFRQLVWYIRKKSC
ncbi:MAG: RNA methyltransferase [Deltaproteobacteria bacterium]|nr:RNA methyltransferase [Deltaproteobacteria bacterium]